MNLERILKRFKDHYKEEWGIRSDPEETRGLIKEYLAVPLTLPISDKPMRRVCEVLTRAGYETTSSCEGHGKSIPYIFFDCPSQYHVRHLTNIARSESHEKNFSWPLRTYSSEVVCNPEQPLSFVIEPNLAFTNSRPDNPKDYQKLIDDLDIIGICVLRYFHSVGLKNLEKYRKMADDAVKNFKVPKLPDDFFKRKRPTRSLFE